MYNHMLDTFIAAADCGSFTKAAELLYISPTAVMKQMNTLEEHLDMKLLERTPSGVHLTRRRHPHLSGCQIHDRVFPEVHRGRQGHPARPGHYFLRGHLALNPAKPFMDLWYRVNRDFPEYKLHLVTFEDDHKGILTEIEQLGKKFDFLIGVCDSREWLRRCNFLALGRYKKMVAVSREHPLAGKNELS